MQRRSLIGVLLLVVVVGILGYLLELSFPTRPPTLDSTYTPLNKPAPQEIGSYDVLGTPVSKADAEQLLQTETGQVLLAPDKGAIAITQDLIDVGQDAFYRETFGNEFFFTDVVGAIDGPINLVSVSKAIAALGGKHTTNLQIPLDKDVTVGRRTFKAGTKLNTGLDVPAGSLVPLGMTLVKSGAKLRMGLTCALCHATVDNETGRILEGPPNNDLDSRLLAVFIPVSSVLD